MEQVCKVPLQAVSEVRSSLLRTPVHIVTQSGLLGLLVHLAHTQKTVAAVKSLRSSRSTFPTEQSNHKEVELSGRK